MTDLLSNALRKQKTNCRTCGGQGFDLVDGEVVQCQDCEGNGYLTINGKKVVWYFFRDRQWMGAPPYEQRPARWQGYLEWSDETMEEKDHFATIEVSYQCRNEKHPFYEWGGNFYETLREAQMEAIAGEREGRERMDEV